MLPNQQSCDPPIARGDCDENDRTGQPEGTSQQGAGDPNTGYAPAMGFGTTILSQVQSMGGMYSQTAHHQNNNFELQNARVAQEAKLVLENPGCNTDRLCVSELEMKVLRFEGEIDVAEARIQGMALLREQLISLRGNLGNASNPGTL